MICFVILYQLPLTLSNKLNMSVHSYKRFRKVSSILKPATVCKILPKLKIGNIKYLSRTTYFCIWVYCDINFCFKPAVATVSARERIRKWLGFSPANILVILSERWYSENVPICAPSLLGEWDSESKKSQSFWFLWLQKLQYHRCLKLIYAQTLYFDEYFALGNSTV